MDYKTLMVHLELGQPNDKLLTLTARLAERHQAHVIGIATCQPIQLAYNETYVDGGIITEDRKLIEKQMKQAELELHAALDGKAKGVEWRSAVTFGPLADFIAEQARAADLVITGPDIKASVFDHSRQTGIADLVMQEGRPVLIVPKDRADLPLDRVIVAWKGTRECRRAVMDALPMLKMARNVTVVEIAPDEEMSRSKRHVADVADWLGRHGVKAEPEAVVSSGIDSDCLSDLGHQRAADLIVAGFYGQSRLREWVLGGVTSDFLRIPNRCVLVSH